MTDEYSELTDFQIDTLREVGNIGAGNAAGSLSVLVRRKIDINVPRLRTVPFSTMMEEVGGAETLVAGIYLQVKGPAPCGILFLLPLESAYSLVDMLMGLPVGSTQELGEMEKSALQELGNILTGAYLNSLAQFAGLEFNPSVPALSVDMAGAILSTVVSSIGEVGDRALMLETEFMENMQQIGGDFFLLPEPGALDTILKQLGVKN